MASWPSKAAVTESTDERSAVRTVTESGKLAEEDGRLTTVTLNFPDWTSALSVGSRPPGIMTSWIHTPGSSLFEYVYPVCRISDIEYKMLGGIENSIL